MVNILHYSFHSKDAYLWISPLITKGTRRSPNSWIYDTGSYSPKVRWVRLNSYNTHISPALSQIYIISSCNILHLGSTNNKANMPTTDGPKGSNSLFFSRAHENRGIRNFHNFPVRNKRGTYINDCPRPNILCLILLGEITIRTK